LDLVQAVLNCDLRRAVEWVTSRWYVPDVPRGRHAKRAFHAASFRIGTTGLPFEWLVRSGVFRLLSKPGQSLLPVMLTFMDRETGWAVLSQRALRRYAGLSFGGVSKGLHELQNVGLLEFERGPSCSKYRLNFEAPALLELQERTYRKHRAEIDFERECQKIRRAALAANVRPLP
jgi:hypothetical protein